MFVFFSRLKSCKIKMSRFISLLMFFIIWVGLNGIKYKFNYLCSIIITPITVFYLSHKLDLLPKKININILNLISYTLWLILKIIESSIYISKITLKRKINILTSINHVRSLQNTQLGIVIYINSITLTPGTITLDVKKNKILVHALDFNFIKELNKNSMDKNIKKVIIR